MDSARFDALTRLLQEPASRRRAGRLLAGLALAASLGGPFGSPAGAKQRRKRCKTKHGKRCGGKCPCSANGKACKSRNDCKSAYCPVAARPVCQACDPALPQGQRGHDGDEICTCRTTAQGAHVCTRLATTAATDCKGCPAGTHCVPFGTIYYCHKLCGVA